MSSTPPPTGIYEVTAKVVADDCSPGFVPPAPWRTQVIAGAEGERAKINVALSAVPPATGTTSAARSDFVIGATDAIHHRLTPQPSCAEFGIDYDYSLARSDADGFAIAITAAYGDPGSCTTSTPTKCTTKVEYDYRVVEKQCAAACTYGARSTTTTLGDPTLAIDCRC